MKFLQDLGLLNDIVKNADIILNPDNWEIVEIQTADHTCGDEVQPYHSDRENLGRIYSQRKMELNDYHGTMAWDMSSKIFESGFGVTYDGQVLGTKSDYQSKIKWARGKTKAAPANQRALIQKN